MSSYKKLSLLERLKEIFKSHHNDDDATGDTAKLNKNKSNVVQSASLSNLEKVDLEETYSKSSESQDIKTKDIASKNNSLKRRSQFDNSQFDNNQLNNSQSTNSQFDKQQVIDNDIDSKISSQPITDAVLDFLDNNELAYRHHSAKSNHSNDAINDNQDTSSSDSRKYIHHISMAMRHYTEAELKQERQQDREPKKKQDRGQGNRPNSSVTANIREKASLEWVCVIRIHEHTQLVALYGILPFALPTSHLHAGMILATQLNYDMMLGNIEIDLRDGEIRLKNSIDVEPILNTNDNTIPADIINHLLKSVITMMTSIYPLFQELIEGDPDIFKLDNIRDQIETLHEDVYLLVSKTIQ